MSFAARRMMGAAARRAFHSQRPSSSRISITKEETRALSYLDAQEKANLPQVLCQLDTMTRRLVSREIEYRSKYVRIDANPSRGPPDGVIWYGRTWANNLAAVILVSAWYGMSQVRANENQKSDHMSSKSPPS